MASERAGDEKHAGPALAHIQNTHTQQRYMYLKGQLKSNFLAFSMNMLALRL